MIASGGGNLFDAGMKSNQLSEGAPVRDGKARGLYLLLLFIVVAGVVFHALWASGAILMTSDDNLGHISLTRRILQSSPLGNWTGETLWGISGLSGLHLWALAIGTLPPVVFMNVYHGLCLVVAAWLLALYLKDKGLRPAACVLGGLVAYWVGTNLTLTYAGHIGKYGTMMSLSLAIFALGRWGRTGRAAWVTLAGAATGAMYLEQPDVSLFCTVLLIPLALQEGVRAVGGWKIGAMVKQAWGGALAAALLAGGTSLTAMGSGVDEVPGGESPEAHWAYITQWSQPPEESLDFIAPGWTGWRSGYDRGPYWGRMGRSEGWEQTRQGFMNFKLETVYVGAVPLLFALIGLAGAIRMRRDGSREAATVFLWGGLCVLALLLAFGKYFVLYKPLSLLPGFGSIRNPNKFIHFFQVSWGVLAAFGLDAALRMPAAVSRRWRWGAVAAGGVLLLAGAALWADLGSGAERLAAAGWGAYGRSIQWNKAFSVTYAGGALLLGAGILALLARGVFHGVEKSVPQSGKNAGGFPPSGKKFSTVWKNAVWLPALVVVFEAAVILAPHYIQRLPAGYVAENDLIRYLKRDLGMNRTAMATQDGFYNLWLTYLFPYHGISSVNVTQLPRPPADYQAFWEAVRDPVRTWQLAAVSHVLAHGPVAKQLLANPAWASQLELGWAYQPFDDGRGGVGTRGVKPSLEAAEVVMKLKPVPPRVAVVTVWREVEDDAALKTLADPVFRPFSEVLLAPGSGVPPPPEEQAEPAKLEVERVAPGRYDFTVETSGPVVVRVAEKYDGDWKATINGEPARVLRVDYMFQGIALPGGGTFEVKMGYYPSRLPVALQAAGLLAGLGAAVALALPRRKREAAA